MATTKLLYDHTLTGGVDTKGIIKQVENDKAIENALTLWLTSLQGDYIGKPDEGGVLYQFITKPMNQINLIQFETLLSSAILQSFYPDLEITDIRIEPFYEQRYWKITIKGISNTYQTGFTFSQKFKNLV